MKLSISPREAILIAALQGIIAIRLVMSAYSHIVDSHSFHPIASGIASVLHAGVSSTAISIVNGTVAALELLLAGALVYGMSVLVRRTPPFITRKGLLVTITGLAATAVLSTAAFLAHGWSTTPEALFSIALVPFMLAGIVLAAVERAGLPTEPRLLTLLLADYR